MAVFPQQNDSRFLFPSVSGLTHTFWFLPCPPALALSPLLVHVPRQILPGEWPDAT